MLWLLGNDIRPIFRQWTAALLKPLLCLFLRVIALDATANLRLTARASNLVELAVVFGYVFREAFRV